MSGWEAMPHLIELGVWTKAHKRGREMTEEEKADAYREETERVFNALLKANVARDLNWANYCEAQRRTASVTGLLKVAGVAELLAFFLVATALGF